MNLCAWLCLLCVVLLRPDALGRLKARQLYVHAASQASATLYDWDAQDRLLGVTMPGGTIHDYLYDYRTRRVATAASDGNGPVSASEIVFAGGLSLAEYDSSSPQSTIGSPGASTVHYVRGPDMGGGVGGMLYSVRGSTLRYSLSNGRGDIVAQSDENATLTWTASYEAYGKRPAETGTNLDKQRANSKDEDPTGLLNEGFRYRDIETGVFMSRDPAGFVDGPNLYAYVKQNPWTAFDPDGLRAEVQRTSKLKPSTKAKVSKNAQLLPGGGQDTHTHITVTGVLINRSSAKYTKDQMDAFARQMTDTANNAFKGEDATLNQSWSMDLRLRVVESDAQIGKDDHVFNIVDHINVPGRLGDVAEYAGMALTPAQLARGVVREGFGGKTALLSRKELLSGQHPALLGRTGAHELGHELGLQHPDDSNNRLKPWIQQPDNLMQRDPRHEATRVVRQQIDHIHNLFKEGALNRPQVPDFGPFMHTN